MYRVYSLDSVYSLEIHSSTEHPAGSKISLQDEQDEQDECCCLQDSENDPGMIFIFASARNIHECLTFQMTRVRQCHLKVKNLHQKKTKLYD